jgi:hypothetical protein
MYGALSGLIITIIVMQILQSHTIRIIENTLKDTRKIAENAFEINSLSSTINQKARDLSKLSPSVQKSAINAINTAIDGFQFNVKDHYIHIRGRRLALGSYCEFWDDLRSVQNTTKRAIRARVTHSSEIDIFYDKYFRENVKPIQSDFAKRGHIFRIFIDTSPRQKDRIEKYVRIMDNMSDINCAYINLTSPQHDNLREMHLESEFCIEDHNHSSAQWIIKEAREVEAFRFSINSSEYEKNISKWNDIISLVERYDYSNNDPENHYSIKLTRHRNKFIENYKKEKGILSRVRAISKPAR